MPNNILITPSTATIDFSGSAAGNTLANTLRLQVLSDASVVITGSVGQIARFFPSGQVWVTSSAQSSIAAHQFTGSLGIVSFIGTASRVENGVYTIGNQTIAGVKTFSDSISFSNAGVISALNLGNNNIVGVNNMEIADPGPNEGLSWLGGNLWKIYESPNDLTTNSGGNLQIVENATRRATFNTSGQLDLPVATGTAPLVIASTTKVTNLNADLLDGYDTATANTANTVVVRNASGNFSAGTITAYLAGYADAVDSNDTRSTNDTPTSRNSGVYFDFKANSTNALSDGGTYNGQMTWRSYGSGTDLSGGQVMQIAYTENSRIWTRLGNSNTTWASWRQLLNSVDQLFAYNMNQNVRTTDVVTHAGMTLTGTLNMNAGNIIQLYTGAGSLRGYIQATDTDDAHLIIATSGGEDITFRDGGTGGTTNMVIRANADVEAYNSFIAPIFYDTNTAWYGDFASVSRMNTIRGNQIATTYHSMTSTYYGGGATPSTGYLITTNIDYSSFNMPIVIIEGYAYGSSVPIKLTIVWYSYSPDPSGWTNLSYINTGGWDPGTITIGRNGSGKVCIHLSNNIYYGRFNVRAIYDQGHSFLEGWTVSEAGTGGLSQPRTIPRVSIASDITGNAGSETLQTVTSRGQTSNQSLVVTGLRLTSTFDIATNDVYGNMRVIRNAGGGTADGMYIGYANAGSAITRIFGGGSTGGALEKYAGYTYEPGSFRAPIFYDSDNTSYYVDPLSTSQLVQLNLYGGLGIQRANNNTAIWWNGVGDTNHVLWNSYFGNSPSTRGAAGTGTDGIRWWTYQGIGIYGGTAGAYPIIVAYNTSGNANTHTVVLYGYNGAQLGTENGYAYANNQFRAPIFYDSNNTGYYADPASTSSFNAAYFYTIYHHSLGGGYYFTNGDWGWRHQTPSGWIQFGPANTSHAHIYTDRSNFYFNVDDSYLNGRRIIMENRWVTNTYYGTGGDVYATIWYDANNSGYYSDPNGTSRMNYMVPNRIKLVNNVNYEPRWDFTAYVVEAQHWYGNNSSMTMYLGESSGNSLQIVATPYASIMYDRDNSAFYCDPNGVTRLSRVRIEGAESGWSLMVGPYTLSTNGVTMVISDNDRYSVQVNAPYYPHIGISSYANASNPTHGPVLSFTGFRTAGGYRRFMMGIANTNPNEMSFGWFDNESNPHYGVGLNWSYPASVWYDTGHNWYARGSMRSPIFYDLDNTGYYFGGGSGTAQFSDAYANDWFRAQGCSGFYFQSYGRGVRAAECEGNSYGTMATYGGGNNGWVGYGLGSRYVFMSTLGDNVGVHDNSRGWVWYMSSAILYLYYGGSERMSMQSYGVYVNNRLDTPILYDANNTGYYLNPDSTSYLYHLILSGAAYFRPQTWIQFDGGYGLYWPNNYGGHFYPNDGSTYTQFRINGQKNGYDGIWCSYSLVNGMMYDGGGNGGVYREANGRWYFYYHLGNDCMGVGTSSTSSTYSLYLNKGVYAQSRIDATIFYDTNNTGYYLDPTSTNSLRTVGDWRSDSAGWTGEFAGKIQYHASNWYFQYASQFIFRNSGGGNVFYGDTSGNVWSYAYRGNGNVGGTGEASWHPAGMYSGGTQWLYGAMYRNGAGTYNGGEAYYTIMYDNNNSAYYMDPNGGSRLNAIYVNGGDSYGAFYFYSNLGGYGVNNSSSPALQAYSSGNNSAFMSFHKGGYYAVNMGLDADNVLRIGGWSAAANRWELDMSGNNWVAGSFRSPIFYDSQDTGYYLDPHNTDNQGLRIRGGTLHGPNWTWGAYLRVGTNGHLDGWAHVMTTNGNLHLDPRSGYDTYIGWYNGGTTFFTGAIQPTIMYDRNNTGYYNDPDGTSRMNYMIPNRIKLVNNVNNDPRWDFTAYVMEAQHWYGNFNGQTMYLGEDSNAIQIRGTPRAPIYYDYNDTNWYVDPNSTSRLWRLNLINRLYIEGGNPGTPDNDTTPQVFFKTGGGLGLSSIEIDFWTGFTGSSYPSNFQIGFRMAYDKRLYVWWDVIQNYSDERLKNKVGLLTGALDAVKSWTPFKYTDNEIAKQYNYNSPNIQIGLSAQEVQQYYPELVELAPFDVGTDFSDESNIRKFSKSGNNYLTINYLRLVPILVQAIKEQQVKIEELQEQINVLKAG